MGVQNLLNSYRSRGHLAANLDPLGIRKRDRATIEDRLNNLTRDDLEAEYDTEVPGPGRCPPARSDRAFRKGLLRQHRHRALLPG
jgi:hypothetical protein